MLFQKYVSPSKSSNQNLEGREEVVNPSIEELGQSYSKGNKNIFLKNIELPISITKKRKPPEK